ncbi:MAG: histidine kinase [Bacteroidales bacterium]|nr:histidine kinase [Bacteroidales bacterium]
MKKTKKHQNLIIILAVAIFSIIFSIIFKWIQTGDPFSQETLLYGILIFLNMLIPLILARYVFKYLSEKRLADLKRKIIPAIIAFVPGVLLIQLVIIGAGVYLYFVFNGLDRSDFLGHLFSVELPGAVRQFSVWILIGSAVLFYYIWRRAEAAEQELREINLKYRYRTLKSQVNPHFLFNSLNTISQLVYEDPGEADGYIQKLAGIYRYVMENEEKELVPLDKEIDFVRSFFMLYREREEGKISLDINVNNAEDYMIIPVSLQSLLENAIKHNAASRERPLLIEIRMENGWLVVSNNIQKKNIMGNSLGLGLENLKERFKMITGRDLVITDNDNYYTVKIPLNKAKDASTDN